MDEILNSETDYASIVMHYGQKLIIAILILIIGFWIAGIMVKTVKKVMEKKGFDPALQSFLGSMLSITLKAIILVSALGTMGIEMTSFVALIGAAGLAVGMALSGTLQNFAGGVMILLFKPFKIGDVVEAQGYTGSVSEIQIFNTIMKTPDNKTIIIPNGGLSTGSMVNYSAEPRRRVDWTIGIGYGDDVDKGRSVIQGMLDADTRVLKDPAVVIVVSELGDSSVNFAVRAWVEAGDFWGVYFDLNENVYKNFDKEGLNIPYPQMDVHVHND